MSAETQSAGGGEGREVILTFGLLAIPIKLYTAARSQRINLHQLHKKCHTRLKQPLFCPHCNRQVERDEVVKGYEYEKGQYVIVSDEELKKITPRSSTVMELVASSFLASLAL